MRVNIDDVVDAVLEIEPPPCEEGFGCRNYAACGQYKMCCEQFAAYVGSVKKNKREYSEINQRPSRAIFNCIYPPEGQECNSNSGPLRKALAEARR